MKNILNRFAFFFQYVKGKIAFYPSLFALSGLLFAFFMMYLEERGISNYLVDHVSFLVVNSGDTALTILSACITGLISMMVFSFSMVMVLLNQAASNYTPRLLPGLISDHRHQTILGIYISSIIYNIFILFYIQPTGNQYQIPGFSVLIGIIFTVISIYAFIYFIHNISESIQITNILEKTFFGAKDRMKYLLKDQENIRPGYFDSAEWHEYKTTNSGYFQSFSKESLIEFCHENNTQLDLLAIRGSYVMEGMPVVRSKEELSPEVREKLFGHLNLSRKELVTDNYVLAMKQITEVVIKAMSPGINDPGTALNALDYLGELIRLRMLKNDSTFISDKKNGKVLIRLKSVSFKDLLYHIFAPIRNYCKSDIVVVEKLGYLIYNLKQQEAADPNYYRILDLEADRLFTDARKTMDNPADTEVIEFLYSKLGLESTNRI